MPGSPKDLQDVYPAWNAKANVELFLYDVARTGLNKKHIVHSVSS